MRAISIPFLALVMTARASAEAPVPEPIEVFTDHRHPVARVTHRDIVIYRFDAINRIEHALSVNLPANVGAARPEAIDRLEHIGRIAVTTLKHTYQGLLKARRYGLDRYPAIVFDDQAVVYGVTHMEAAVGHYRQWRHQHEGRLP